MFIKKTRINSCKPLSAAKQNTPIHIIVNNVGRFQSQMEKFGFRKEDENGTSILPCIVNRYAKKNAEPFFIIDKTLPKEEYTQEVYWTRYEWAGKGQLNPVTEFSYITKKRYHRDYFAPYSVYFTLVSNGDDNYIMSDEILFKEENYDKILNTVNMVLCLFGECFIDYNETEHKTKKTVVNWDILPKGEYPWEVVKKSIADITREQSNTRREMMFRNCETIYEKKPDFVAYGRSGFKGYAVFGFESKKLYILESAMPNNATYILQNDWETISQLTKAEILSQKLHTARIVHSKNWQIKLDNIMEDNNG